VLKGRLGLETARVPHADRHGLLWLSYGRLYVEDGTLRFATAGSPDLPAGDYAIPFQLISCVILQPGCTVSHDALRLLARHGTGLVATGEDGVRMYASMPHGPDDSAVARAQVQLWMHAERRTYVARRMYALRLGEVLPHADITVLRGIEGARAKETYRRLADHYGIDWKGRRYDRADPETADLANQAINHAATAVEAAALVAVASVGAIPQLGFVHEDSGHSFALDIADLFRDTVTLPVAFGAVKAAIQRPGVPLERTTRKTAGKTFRERKLIPSMIDRIKELLLADDRGSDR
jgi:CRISP-associated protein Cas1